MSMPTLTYNTKFAYTITLFRNGRRVFYVFRNHWLSFHAVEEDGYTIYYLIAHEIFGGEDTFVSLNKKEYEILQYENNRPIDEGANFKKAVKAYNRQVGKAERCERFCDELLNEVAAALDAHICN